MYWRIHLRFLSIRTSKATRNLGTLAQNLYLKHCHLKKQFNAHKQKEFPWVYEVTKYASQQPFINLQKAFQRFFNSRRDQTLVGAPKFKKKGRSRDSFYIGGDQIQVKIKEKQVRIPRLGWVTLREALRFEGKINGVVISRTADRWYISFSIETQQQPEKCKSQASIGVDLGVKKMATLSNGEEIVGPKPLGQLLLRLKRYQRSHFKKDKGSCNRKKSQMKLARLHRRIANTRQDALHKLTSYLTDNFQRIAIEDLNVKGMLSNRRLARSISDIGFYEFKRQLIYKAEEKDCNIVLANRFYASSKICSRCGTKKADLSLSDRIYDCVCGNKQDRDINAAINLERLCNIVSTESSSGIYACGQNGNEFVFTQF